MVYGGADEEILQINEESLWSGRQIREEYSASPEVLAQIRSLLFDKKIDEAFALCEKHLLSNPPMVRHYQTFGNIRICFSPSEYTAYRKVLDMDRAVVETTYQKGNARYKSETFISQGADALVYRLTATEPFLCTLSMERLRDCVTVAEDDTMLQMTGKITWESDELCGPAGEGLSFCGCLQVETNGETKTDGTTLTVQNATELTISRNTYRPMPARPVLRLCYVSICRTTRRNMVIRCFLWQVRTSPIFPQMRELPVSGKVQRILD